MRIITKLALKRINKKLNQQGNIYIQRKDHILPEWRVFCQWIETLPYADKFLTN